MFMLYELLLYDDFVFYIVVCVVVLLLCIEFKVKVIDSFEVLSVFNRLFGFGDFLNVLYKCDYCIFMLVFFVVVV